MDAGECAHHVERGDHEKGEVMALDGGIGGPARGGFGNRMQRADSSTKKQMKAVQKKCELRNALT